MGFLDSNMVVDLTYIKFNKAADTVSGGIPKSKPGDGSLDKTKVSAKLSGKTGRFRKVR